MSQWPHLQNSGKPTFARDEAVSIIYSTWADERSNRAFVGPVGSLTRTGHLPIRLTSTPHFGRLMVSIHEFPAHLSDQCGEAQRNGRVEI